MESAIREHLDEGDVIRLLDGEATAEERAAWTAHLDGCEECRRLSEELREVSGWFSSTIALLDNETGPDELTRARALAALRASVADQAQAAPAPLEAVRGTSASGNGIPTRRRSPIYRLAAAGIGVILVAGLAVEPVRAWIRENVLSIQPQTEAPVVEVSPEAASPTPTTAAAGFTVRGPTFRIELGQRQIQGTLTIRSVSQDQASARIVGSVTETLVVLPSGLLVGNAPDSKASYVVELPVGEVREVVIRAGGQTIGSRTLSAAGEEVVLDLASGATVP